MLVTWMLLSIAQNHDWSINLIENMSISSVWQCQQIHIHCKSLLFGCRPLKMSSSPLLCPSTGMVKCVATMSSEQIHLLQGQKPSSQSKSTFYREVVSI